MPYLQAVVKEALRLHPPGPLVIRPSVTGISGVYLEFSRKIRLSRLDRYTEQRNSKSREVDMRCNACWREVEGRAISTTCGHLLCTEDANKILSNDGACPIFEHVLSKSLMKPVDINRNEEWLNMAMAGISPQIRILFLVKQHCKVQHCKVQQTVIERDLEIPCKMNRVVAQCPQKCEGIQSKFSEKMEQRFLNAYLIAIGAYNSAPEQGAVVHPLPERRPRQQQRQSSRGKGGRSN
ncbi:hypothetical protein F2Q69_00041538 [Brassica cretica]|uniref:Uncharacterized protein n=1 Tax=Brassica cretica TaxID=69181 RepID=A0A8S9NKA9_BRACR|nr:hypothetical protein F2Q69_00041538 [Brassica cretica]